MRAFTAPVCSTGVMSADLTALVEQTNGTSLSNVAFGHG